MTDVLDTSPASIARAAECLRAGGLVAFPTETVYGLGVDALDAAAVRRLFAAKGRPANDPLIVHLASADAVAALVGENVPAHVSRLAARFWPGPLTLVLPRPAAIPPEVTAGGQTVAVRVPAHPVARALLEAARLPIAAPSANLFSRPSPTRAEHVLSDLDGRIDLLLDGGPTTVGVESTVLDLTSSQPTVLRPGAVTLEMLRDVVEDVRVATTGQDTAQPGVSYASPGMMSKHYSPRAPLTLFSGPADAALAALVARAREATASGRRVGVLVAREHAAAFGGMPFELADLGSREDPSSIAARLYAALRQLDAARVDLILALDPLQDEGLGRAVGDRLRRAAQEHVRLDA